MTALSLFCGLFGCRNAPKPAKHELSEITALSISCGHMDRRYGYSFWVHKEENAWFLYAECFTDNYETETVIENAVLMSDDVEALFKILELSESIAYVENYKKPKNPAFQIADEETYGFCLGFSDGSQYAASGRQADLENFFYRLAEKN